MRAVNSPRSPEIFTLSDEITQEFAAIKVGDLIKQRYEVLEHIGAGGMGDVYRGWDEQFCRDVAIKVLKRERINDSMRKRVLREARATCAVDHPHMVRVTDMGVVHDAPFLVMDLLRGVSLAEKLRRAPEGRLDWRWVVSMMLPVMEALHTAHEAGVVHRDLKPENLFVHHRSGAEVLIVLDLGLVKFADADGTPPPRWTQTGQILGTAAYMSPEQANSGTIDRRSDIYSLGVTLYRVLTGQHLFPCATGDGPIVAMTCHLFEEPPRLGPEFPDCLAQAVARALVKDPQGRHDTMEAFAGALRACLAGVTRPERKRRRVWPALARVGDLAIGATLVLVIQQFAAPDAAAGVNAPPGTSPPRIAEVEAAGDVCEPSELSEPVDLGVESACELVPGPELRVPPAVAVGRSGRRSTPSAAVVAEAAPPVEVADPFLEATGGIHRCVRDHGDRDIRALTVRLKLRSDGSVASGGIRGDNDASMLGNCVQDRLLRLRFDPGPPADLEYTYRFGRQVSP